MPGNDSYTKLLLHFNEADGSTATDDASSNNYTVTANGNVQTDSGVTKFGNTSLFDGTGDYWSLADSADWQLDGGSDANAWTIDFWARFNGDPGTGDRGFLQQYVNDGNNWYLALTNNALRFWIISSGTKIVNIAQTWNPADATLYHVAIVKNGTTGYLHFIDGSQIGVTTVDTSTCPDFAGGLRVGLAIDDAGGNDFMNGWMEEVRISKGIARWTGNFTPPTAEYDSSGGATISKFMLLGVG